LKFKDAIDFYHQIAPHRPVELNFALMDGINDSDRELDLISEWFPNEYIKLSQFNPIPEKPFKASTRYHEFANGLRNRGLTVEYHATDGSTIGAACGQTRGEHTGL